MHDYNVYEALYLILKIKAPGFWDQVLRWGQDGYMVKMYLNQARGDKSMQGYEDEAL